MDHQLFGEIVPVVYDSKPTLATDCNVSGNHVLQAYNPTDGVLFDSGVLLSTSYFIVTGSNFLGVTSNTSSGEIWFNDNTTADSFDTTIDNHDYEFHNCSKNNLTCMVNNGDNNIGVGGTGSPQNGYNPGTNLFVGERNSRVYGKY